MKRPAGTELGEQIIDALLAVAPEIGLALIDRDFHVVWANEPHSGRYDHGDEQPLVGSVCYSYVNAFSSQCPWCPVRRVFADGGLHRSLAASPGTDETLKYSDIVSFPYAMDQRNDVSLAAEVIFDLTDQERERHEYQSAQFLDMWKLALVIEQVQPPAVSLRLMALGLVGRSGLRFDRARVVEVNTTKPGGRLRGVAEYATEASSEVDRLLQKVISSGHGSFSNELRGQVVALAIQNPPPPESLASLVGGRYRLNTIKAGPFPVRTSPHELAVSVSGARPHISCIMLASVRRDTDLLREEMFAEVAAYAGYLSRSMLRREAIGELVAATRRIDGLSESLEQKEKPILVAASAALSLTHDIGKAQTAMARPLDELATTEFGRSPGGRTAWTAVAKDLKSAHAFLERCSKKLGQIGAFLDVKYERLRLGDLAEEVLQWFETDFDDKGISVVRDFQDCESPVRGDRDYLLQAVMNLVFNAYGALTRSPRRKKSLSVMTWVEADRVCLCVKDNGPGIHPDTKPHIWRLFFSTTERGTGLGLYVVKHVVEVVHGGTVSVDSRPDHGAAFTVRLKPWKQNSQGRR